MSSSTVDQRSSKLVESQAMSPHMQTDVGYAYPQTQAMAVQSGYHMGIGLAEQADPSYQMYGSAEGGPPPPGSGYDPAYMAFTGGMMADPSSVWSTDPSMAYSSYGPAEYLPYGDGSGLGGSDTANGPQYGMMPGQYDYSAVSWFPGMNCAAAWGQSSILPMQQPTKSRFIDYSSGTYYDGMTMDNSILARAGVSNQQASNNNMSGSGRYPVVDMNGYQNVEQSFRSLQLSPSAVPVENGNERSNSFHENSVAAVGIAVGGGDVGQYEAGNKQPSAAPVNSGNGAVDNTSETTVGNSVQKKSWANVASLPAAKTSILVRPKTNALPRGMLAVSAGVRQEAMMNSRSSGSSNGPSAASKHQESSSSTQAPVPGQYNPKEFDCNAKGARFFVIKSFSEDDIHRSIKFSIWCSTEYGNKRLDAAYRERDGKGPIYLLFSVNGSGHFCGVALMTSAVDYQCSSSVWQQDKVDKWKGTFSIQWIFVKDVPNSQLRHIRLENNEGKPVTNSRDTQEVPAEKGRQVLRIIHQYRHTTSIFDDFQHYEKQLTEQNVSTGGASSNNNNNYSSSTTGNNNSSDNNSNTSNDNGVNGNRQSAVPSNKVTK